MDNRLIVWSVAYVGAYQETRDPVRATQRATEVVAQLYEAASAVMAEHGASSDEAWSLASVFGLRPLDMTRAGSEVPRETGMTEIIARVRAGCDHVESFIACAQLAKKAWCDSHRKSELAFWGELLLCVEDRHENGDEALRRLAYGFHSAIGVHKGTSTEELTELTWCASRVIARLRTDARLATLREGRR